MHEGLRANRQVTKAASTIQAETFFEKRRERANLDAFDRALSRKGGLPPRSGDERAG